MERGNSIHKIAENYTKGNLVGKFPEELSKFKSLFVKLKAGYKKKMYAMDVEETWAFTKDWVRTKWDDWNGCRVRIKLDNASHENPTTLVIRDWKTGKFRPEQHEDYLKQLSLYALGGFRAHEHIKTIKPQLVYLDQGEIYPKEKPLIYVRKQLPMLTKEWEDRVKPMLSDTFFAPRPSNGCHWCHYRKSNGGPCQF